MVEIITRKRYYRIVCIRHIDYAVLMAFILRQGTAEAVYILNVDIRNKIMHWQIIDADCMLTHLYADIAASITMLIADYLSIRKLFRIFVSKKSVSRNTGR